MLYALGTFVDESSALLLSVDCVRHASSNRFENYFDLIRKLWCARRVNTHGDEPEVSGIPRSQ